MDDKSSLSYTVKRFERRSPTLEKSLRSSHYVQEVTSFDPPVPCLIHYNDNVTHICIECEYKCLCGTCLQEGSHRDHNIKNVEKGSKIVDRILNETLIRLRSKSDLLTHLNDSMSIRKSELYSEYKDYLLLLDNNFEILVRDLVQRKEILLESVNSYYEQQLEKLRAVICSISEETRNSIKMIEFITDNIEKLEPVSLCLFFWEKKAVIEGAVDEVNKKMDSYKQEVPDIKSTLDYEIFDQIREQIQSLRISSTNDHVELEGCGIQTKPNLPPPPRIKGSKLDKITSHSGYETPKGGDSSKDINRFFKSPTGLKKKIGSSRKLMSMPASPSKDKTPKKKSPSKAKIERKFRKTKKEPK